MQRLLLLAMLITAPSLVLGQPTQPRGNRNGADAQAVRRLLDQATTAVGHNDATTLGRVYADDYTMVNESGVLSTRAQRLAAFTSGALKYDSLNMDDVNVRMYGNTAVATYRVTSKGQLNGRDIGGRFRATSTFVKLNGRWRLAATQTTRITGQ